MSIQAVDIFATLFNGFIDIDRSIVRRIDWRTRGIHLMACHDINIAIEIECNTLG